MRWRLIAIAMTCGCLDDVAIGRGTCGNWVLETGEDCDRPGDVCTADCRIHCDPAAHTACVAGFDGMCCPDGFACGVDQACHAPSGSLASDEVSVPVELSTFQIGDLDGDHIADVIGIAPDAVVALYGSSHAPLSVSISRAAPASSGRPAIGDYTGDGRLDVIWPVADGLLGYDSASGSPQQALFPAAVTPHVDHLRMAGVGGGSDLVRIDYRSDVGQLVILDDNGVQAHQLCSHTLAPTTLAGRALHPFDDGGTGQHIVVPIQLAPPDVPPLICLDGTGTFNGFLFTPLINTEPADLGEAFFAKLDPTEPCPDLIAPTAPDHVESTIVVAGAVCTGLNGPPCTGPVGSCTVDAYVPHVVSPVGAPLAAMTLGFGETAIVTSEGIYLANCGESPASFCQLLPATRTWRYAVVADFDGDGLDDVAIASAESDVEVIYQTTSGQWLVKHVATDGAVAELASGDFDGDGLHDLAIAVTDPTDPHITQLRFAFSTGRVFAPPTPAVPVVDLHNITVTRRIDPAVPFSFAQPDVLAISSGDDTRGALTFVYGSVDRAPTAPFIYSGIFGDPLGHIGEGLIAIPGPFGHDASAGVLGVFGPAPSEPSVPSGTLEIAAIEAGPGTLTAIHERAVAACSSGNFCPTTATYASIPEPDGALVLAFADADDHADCGGFYLSTPISTPGFGILSCTDVGGSLTLRGTQSARALRDGTLALATQTELSTWNVGVVAAQPAFTLIANLTAVVGDAVGAPATCTDVVQLELGTRVVGDTVYGAGLDLAVACQVGAQTGVFAVFASPTAMMNPVVTQLFAIDGAPAIELQSGDVNGDGVDDLVYTTRTGGVGTLHARLQCDSHTTCSP